jgi:hypothetical protein
MSIKYLSDIHKDYVSAYLFYLAIRDFYKRILGKPRPYTLAAARHYDFAYTPPALV